MYKITRAPVCSFSRLNNNYTYYLHVRRVSIYEGGMRKQTKTHENNCYYAHNSYCFRNVRQRSRRKKSQEE